MKYSQARSKCSHRRQDGISIYLLPVRTVLGVRRSGHGRIDHAELNITAVQDGTGNTIIDVNNRR